MANLKLKFDTQTREWEVADLEHGTNHGTENDVNFDDLYIFWGFKNGQSNSIEFDRLRFGFEILNEGQTLTTITRPSTPRGYYIRTDVEFMEIDHVDTDAGKTYELRLWVEEAGQRNEKTINVTIPEYSNYELDYVNTHPEQPDYELFINGD